MPSAATMERRSASGTVSLSSTLSAWLVRASMPASCSSVSRLGRLAALAGFLAALGCGVWVLAAVLGCVVVLGMTAPSGSRPANGPSLADPGCAGITRLG
jgi:hypothetical protein